MIFSDFELCGDQKSIDPQKKDQLEVFYWLHRKAGDSLFVARDRSTQRLCLIRESSRRERFPTIESAELALKTALAENHLQLLSPESRSEAEFTFLKTLCRHFVALAGAYYPIDAAGKKCGEEAFYFYSAFVCKLQDTWFLVTAGHAMEDFLGPLARKEMSISVNWLIDYFGEGAKTLYPIPFNLLDHKIFYVNEDTLGIDGAAILISENEQQLLEANGIKPLGPGNWVIPQGDTPKGFVLLGLPEERTHTVHSGDTIKGLAKPLLLPIQRLQDDETHPFTRFQGSIDPIQPLSTVVGMSGGPIFACVDKDGEVFYYAVAIQSACKDLTIFACPLEAFMRHMLAVLLTRAAAAEKIS